MVYKIKNRQTRKQKGGGNILVKCRRCYAEYLCDNEVFRDSNCICPICNSTKYNFDIEPEPAMVRRPLVPVQLEPAMVRRPLHAQLKPEADRSQLLTDALYRAEMSRRQREEGTEPLSFAIIGDGPTALTILTYLLYCKKTYPSLSNINITVFLGGRGDYTRAHIINVSKTMASILERILPCDKCINQQGNSKDDILMQIKCLELILSTHVNKEGITIMHDKWTSTTTMTSYDHIICADGGRSASRAHYFGNFYALFVSFNNGILALYSDLPESCDDASSLPFKYSYNPDDLKRLWGADYELISKLISLVYIIKQRKEEFKSAPDDVVKKNHWADGFINYDEFLTSFDSTIDYIIKANTNMPGEVNRGLTDCARKHGFIFNSDIKTLIEYPLEIRRLFTKYNEFVHDELLKYDKSHKQFLLHFVTPNCKSFGIHLDNADHELKFCTRKMNTDESKPQKIWLVGDACNTYPPGHSLDIGMRDSIALINIICKRVVPDFKPHFTFPISKEYVGCAQNGLYFKPCPKLSNYRFTGGYSEGNPKNNEAITFDELQRNLIRFYPTLCNTTDNDIDEYNRYQFLNFFNQIMNIFCDETFNLTGGKRTKNKKRKWSITYKKSINCIRPKGFSQKQYCKYGRKNKNLLN